MLSVPFIHEKINKNVEILGGKNKRKNYAKKNLSNIFFLVKFFKSRNTLFFLLV